MKKIKKIAILILMITLLTLIIIKIKAEATTGKVNAETVRLRKEPNSKSTILEQLDKSDEVEVLEQEAGWYKVRATVDGKKITGYISESLIDLEETAEPQPDANEQGKEQPEEIPQENNEQTSNEVQNNGETVPEETNTNNEEENKVKEPEGNTTEEENKELEENKEYKLTQEISTNILPLINSKKKETITEGTIKTVEILNDWCKIESATQEGWIRCNTLKNAIQENVPQEQAPVEGQENVGQPEVPETPKEPENKPEEPKKDTVIKTGYVSTESLKVREEASTSSKEIDSLKKNDKVSILEELEGWYRIKIGGKIGYVSSKYISDKKVEETTSRGTSTERKPEKAESTNQEQPEEAKNPPSGSNGSAVVEYAKQYLGYRYVSGGASPSTGFDCSGFTSYVYKQFGVKLNRTSRDQIKNGTAVERSNLQPGDIVVFNGDSNRTIGHVGIYVGGGNFIHAANPKEGVKITPLSSSYYEKRYVGARRVI
ncbi:MAG: C40 family peptidase [Clostridia bacterium]|nr:C40 family peptidase [Clostridia bacterium]